MADNLILINCDYLQLGMFVAELDRPWLHTPFGNRGFLIENEIQIDTLRMHCNYVYANPGLSDVGAIDNARAARKVAEQASIKSPRQGRDRLACTRQAMQAMIGNVATTVTLARRNNELRISPLIRSAERLVETTWRGADTLLWLLMTDTQTHLFHRRAVGTAALAVIFGRHLGFDEAALRQLALGGLLLDIGKIAVPMPILIAPHKLNATERSFVTRHVSRSLAILRNIDQVPDRVTEMVYGHHERTDGSGYPRGLSGTRIPLFARIAGIADTFDALTRNRRYADGISAHDALRQLIRMRGTQFDDALVDDFVQAVGLYPTGTCVELDDGSLGIVQRQNPEQPEQPHVLLLRHAENQGAMAASRPRTKTEYGVSRTLSIDMLDIGEPELDAAYRRAEAA